MKTSTVSWSYKIQRKENKNLSQQGRQDPSEAGSPKADSEVSMVVHVCNPQTGELEANLGCKGRPSQKKQKKKTRVGVSDPYGSQHSFETFSLEF